MSIQIQSYGINRGVWWYRGVDRENLDLKRFSYQYNRGSIDWYRPSGDSLASEGDTVLCRIVNVPDSIDMKSIAVGTAANLENDLIMSLSLRSFRKGTSLSLAIVPEQPTRYRSLFQKGTVSLSANRNDTTLIFTGQFDEKTFSITDGSGKTHLFDRNGNSLERGTL